MIVTFEGIHEIVKQNRSEIINFIDLITDKSFRNQDFREWCLSHYDIACLLVFLYAVDDEVRCFPSKFSGTPFAYRDIVVEIYENVTFSVEVQRKLYEVKADLLAMRILNGLKMIETPYLFYELTRRTSPPW